MNEDVLALGLFAVLIVFMAFFGFALIQFFKSLIK